MLNGILKNSIFLCWGDYFLDPYPKVSLLYLGHLVAVELI